ncbi:EF-hand domain-containing protein [Kitasatospora sp. NPDC001547]|uniref:EF-hand domain-containing protein n=1 Tax=Kitasatospora sp. NPDC001547 TaxID=3364015 RepID=UPI0036976A26|nr:hypothetical protein KitaXyl93_72460 [Kitasatospora sp. Xyl93]
MSDDLLTTKIALGFDHLDADGDGLLTEYDHVLMGRACAEVLGHARGSDAERSMIAAYVGIWRDLHLPHAGSAQEITRDDFIASTLTLADDPRAAAATIGRLAEVFLSVADADGDGTVDAEEFRAFHRAHFPRLDRDRVDVAFGHLDRDGDGTLSREEFVGAVLEYWTSRDPQAPGNWWTGRHPLQPQ